MRVFTREQGLGQVMSKIHALDVGEVLAIAVPGHKGGIQHEGIVHHELLSSRARAGTGIPDFVELLEKWEPRKCVAASPIVCSQGVVHKPLA